jgi:hypothetical protein
MATAIERNQTPNPNQQQDEIERKAKECDRKAARNPLNKKEQSEPQEHPGPGPNSLSIPLHHHILCFFYVKIAKKSKNSPLSPLFFRQKRKSSLLKHPPNKQTRSLQKPQECATLSILFRIFAKIQMEK